MESSMQSTWIVCWIVERSRSGVLGGDEITNGNAELA